MILERGRIHSAIAKCGLEREPFVKALPACGDL